MKYAIVFGMFCFLFSTLYAQKRNKFLVKQGIGAAQMGYAGWLHGTNEVKLHDYRRFAARRRNADPKWHDPEVSFKNKYADYPTDRSERFLGSKTVFAFATDAYHLNSTLKNILIVGNIGVCMSLYEKPNWKQIVLQAATSWAFYAIGTGAAHAYYKKID